MCALAFKPQIFGELKFFSEENRKLFNMFITQEGATHKHRTREIISLYIISNIEEFSDNIDLLYDFSKHELRLYEAILVYGIRFDKELEKKYKDRFNKLYGGENGNMLDLLIYLGTNSISNKSLLISKNNTQINYLDDLTFLIGNGTRYINLQGQFNELVIRALNLHIKYGFKCIHSNNNICLNMCDETSCSMTKEGYFSVCRDFD